MESLVRFVARAKRERCILASELDAADFELVSLDAGLTTYRHLVTGREVIVDDRGRPHRRQSGRAYEQKLGHAVWELDPLAIRAARPRVRHLHLVR
jgi:hypothetical protein